uniref:MYND-type domain-containing protein n=1 Tax=Mucochytrium quahogii TaxID=96639 RepID=A0A7S2SFI8_9STRA|mmetsp:Transcript_12082/g.19667  ORF Transcript_12082/g.19667 Transcript_12082/m.19667 type:complete len:338 (+) Transcript_12082:173-1186(+)
MGEAGVQTNGFGMSLFLVTPPFCCRHAEDGDEVPLVAKISIGPNGSTDLVLLFSDHKGFDVLEKYTREELPDAKQLVLNGDVVWGICTIPQPKGKLPPGHVVLNGKDFPQVAEELIRQGIVEKQAVNSPEDYPLCRVARVRRVGRDSKFNNIGERYFPANTQCAMCLKQAEKLRACSSCKNSWYCGVDCQKAAWKHHKVWCELTRSQPGFDRDKVFDEPSEKFAENESKQDTVSSKQEAETTKNEAVEATKESEPVEAKKSKKKVPTKPVDSKQEEDTEGAVTDADETEEPLYIRYYHHMLFGIFILSYLIHRINLVLNPVDPEAGEDGAVPEDASS